MASLAVLLVAIVTTNPYLGITRAYELPSLETSVEADLTVNDSLFWSQEKVVSVTNHYQSLTQKSYVSVENLDMVDTYSKLVDQATSLEKDVTELETVPKPEVTPTKSPVRTPQIASVTYDTKAIENAHVIDDAFDSVVIAQAPDEIVTIIQKYAAEYRVDASRMIVIAQCESGMNAGAVSPSGAYVGLFQFVSSTWVSNRNAMGLDSNPALRANAEEAIRTAAFKMSRDGYGAWPVCGRA